MPRIVSSVVVPVSPGIAFAVSQTHGNIRKRWDPFIARQRFLHGATEAAKNVQTETVSKHRFKMISEYTSFRPPTQVGMKMVTGPAFFSSFGGGWSFREADGHTDESPSTEATWRYSFTVKPPVLGKIADPIGIKLLGFDIDKRIAGYAKGCEDPLVIAEAEKLAKLWMPDDH